MTRIALIGAGVIANTHLQASLGVPDAEIVRVADLELSRAQALAEPNGIAFTDDPEAAIASLDIDAVIVAVPTPAHREIAELAASHGKAVLCEKPLARTAEDAAEIVGACERAGVPLMVGQVVRFFPAYQRLQAAIADGSIGRPAVARVSRVGSHPGPSRAWFSDPAVSGGVVLDLMIHELDLLRWWFGEVTRVFATGIDTPRTDLDYAQAVLRFESGTIAHVEASWAHAAFRTTVEVAGERGMLQYDSEATAALRIDRQAHDDDPAQVAHRHVDPVRPWRAQLQHFVDRLRDGAPFLAGAHDGLRAVELALAVRRSIDTRQPVHFIDGKAVEAAEAIEANQAQTSGEAS